MRTGVMAAYLVHLQATLTNTTLPFTREADVVAEGMVLEKRHFTVLAGPGLGVKVDIDVVECYRVAWDRLRKSNVLSQTITKSYIEYSILSVLVATVYKNIYLRVR